MANLYQTIQKRDYDWNYILEEARKRINSRRFDFQVEPTKFLAFGESTYSDHFGPKLNYPPPEVKGPIAIPLACDRAKHLVSTTQQDYDRRTVSTFSGNIYRGSASSRQSSDGSDAIKMTFRESPEEILTTIGPAPLVKTCRQLQEWETSYASDYEYFPPRERMYPFPQ